MSEVDDDDEFLELCAEVEDEMERLVEDRMRMLDRLGMTEHEWACEGGDRFELFRRRLIDTSVVVETVAEVPQPPLPSVAEPPPLPIGPPPLPTLAEQLVAAPSALPPPLPKVEWTSEQHFALEEIEGWLRGDASFFSLTGPAGSGKTTVLREVVDRHPGVILCAMTGKAALRLGYCTGRSASTLHKILYWPPAAGQTLVFDRLREAPGSFVCIDESSMMSPTIYNHLQSWASDGVKILLVGDGYQLPPVITGEESRQHGKDYSVFAEVKGAVLETVMRSVGGVLRAATKIRQTGTIVRESDGEYEYERTDKPLQRAVDEYLSDREDHLLVTWKNAVRMSANRLIRDRIGRSGPLPDEGEPVLIRRSGQGFLTGEVVPCGGFEAGPTIGSLKCVYMRTGYTKILCTVDGSGDGEFFDGQQPWIEDWRKYQIEMKKQCLPEPIPITWAYAFTAHQAQGGEARRVTVFLDRGDAGNPHFKEMTTLPTGEKVSNAARWAYTALTRGKQRAKMIVGR